MGHPFGEQVKLKVLVQCGAIQDLLILIVSRRRGRVTYTRRHYDRGGNSRRQQVSTKLAAYRRQAVAHLGTMLCAPGKHVTVSSPLL